ncbi:MAG: bifunctional methylenetetrahydrofolate dehydrogenase/methenyltetrahydrofolate cyclohydrolase FolD [Clostridia bacterium]|nr:bifunctional methylenetetrahydrofolate dehydrogenase/methenyltetrahydrofolate cyclohydrolase FolD [Clostridia bacterium]MBR4799512.1 bifunctional methylenetetrahydrofolate dehydrogenase/methenyltetrahydrofolate cyclohydrolase FolD [Clostridia bacterium]
MTVIDGKAVSAKVKAEVAEEIKKLCREPERAPGLAVVLVGEDPASQVYVRNKKRACESCGINSFEYLLSADESEENLLALIDSLNRDESVDGILVQMPLPKHISPARVTEAIDPYKDVDGFHSQNVGLLTQGTPRFVPCTPLGVMRLLAEYGVEIKGKNCLVVGRSNIVGKPMSALLLAADGTVTTAHSRTADIASHTLRADIIVAACGRPGMITGDMVKPGAVLIDVGITRVEDKLKGDFDFDSCAPKAAFITPVPGGVGPMTIAMLMQNTLKSYKMRKGAEE